ncbi:MULTISPECIES: EAL domain-containing protein [unclassified Fusibacter]|uniref:EAL domain-containing protein n=1 Tax=unclassified Fusibacter TaxID=2624464 RepID=UPI0010138386|nr:MULTISPECIES: EAL domain-containing protein [unclassified Fusibacter]MCK8058991.1 EAL domain-containing protein [Fusibacter sp. A2]NPE22402.1 EAL domain-containing protein [Fusibacter sp. A1]RXV60509.1 EAL domain-containing protein [Fusibacter sp. A1]
MNSLILKVVQAKTDFKSFYEKKIQLIEYNKATDSIENLLALLLSAAKLKEYAVFSQLLDYTESFPEVESNQYYNFYYCEALGAFYDSTNNFESAIQHYDQAYKYARNLEDPFLILSSRRTLAATYYHNRDLEMALYYSQLAVQSLDDSTDILESIKVYMVYGVILTVKSELETALKINLKALALYEQVDNYKNQLNYGVLVLNTFEVYFKLGNLKMANELLEIGLHTMYDNHYDYFLDDLLKTIADFYECQGQLNYAVKYLKDYIAVNERINSPRPQINEHPMQQEKIRLLESKNELLSKRVTELFHEIESEKSNGELSSLIQNLEDALEHGEITAFYQGKWSVEHRRITGAEALIRWVKDSSVIPPGVFIEKVEEYPIIIELSNKVLKESISFCKEITTAYDPEFTISVNITPYQLINQPLANTIEHFLKEEGLDASHLEIEITERSFYNQNPKIIMELYQIKELGVHISLDDFGVGYSAISCLIGMPVDSVKLDRILINNLGENIKSQKLVAGIIDVVHKLDLKVIAEGVETQKQKDWLIEEACDVLQGYYFSKPVDRKKFIDELMAQE